MTKEIICPNCGHGIDCLINRQSGVKEWKFGFGVGNATTADDYGYEALDDDFQPDDNYNSWCCPNCYKELTDDEDDAVRILRGK
jgi:predicted RNA-binding Zn-ribbon protein involved in translation (DUF1610 family)